MIRQLTESDRSSVLQYLRQDASYNIFPIGDIETFGFDEPFQRVYAEFEEDNIISVFLRYRNNAIYSCHEQRFNTAYLRIFKQDPFDFFSGKTTLTDLVKPHLTGFTNKQMFFCEATSISETLSTDNTDIKVVTTKADCERLYDLLSQVAEFSIHKQSKAEFVEAKLNSIQMGMTLYIEEHGTIVSTVATTAETQTNAMVVAVATLPQYRNKGYASSLMKALMQEYINKRGKSLCLFYDNPQAGAIYMRLGFTPIGTWDMYTKEG
jgi:predicted GNAT family acetyltransferase